MLASNKKITRTHYIVFFIWLIFTFIFTVYFITGRLAPFDPLNRLTGKDSSLLMAELKQMEGLKGVNLNQTIIHFTSDGCTCSQYSEEHKNIINQQAEVDGFNVINIELPENVSTIIPSTPAILIISKTEDLLYLGPYSVGLACSESNGFIEIVMKNYMKGYSASMIVNDAKGCYCNT